MSEIAVLFDLGGTLVDYYEWTEWPAVYAECIERAVSFLKTRSIPALDDAEVVRRMDSIREEERQRLRVRGDWRVWPIEERMKLALFPDGSAVEAGLLQLVGREFIAPMLARARLIPGSLPALEALRNRGLPMAIVTNTPWGSPREPWVEEIHRHGLDEFTKTFVTCRDAGWRKPDRRVFALACDRLGVRAEHCWFVGDEPVWDYEGAAAAGMKPVLLDRKGQHAGKGLTVIRQLGELVGLLE
ncbi:MAG: HAD family hydrolase [Candidatus Coatesbacteria bacterium]